MAHGRRRILIYQTLVIKTYIFATIFQTKKVTYKKWFYFSFKTKTEAANRNDYFETVKFKFAEGVVAFVAAPDSIFVLLEVSVACPI